MDVAAFWSRIERRGEQECWPWRGSTANGYGDLRFGGGKAKAHRLALEIDLGRELADGKFACHTCDNPICCNPSHLYEGDAATNARDMVDRGRACRAHESRRGVRRRDTSRLNALRAGLRESCATTSADLSDWRHLDTLSAKDQVSAFVARSDRGDAPHVWRVTAA